MQWHGRLTENGDRKRREFVHGERMIDVINLTAPSCAWLEVETMEANGDEARTKRDLNRER